MSLDTDIACALLVCIVIIIVYCHILLSPSAIEGKNMDTYEIEAFGAGAPACGAAACHVERNFGPQSCCTPGTLNVCPPVAEYPPVLTECGDAAYVQRQRFACQCCGLPPYPIPP